MSADTPDLDALDVGDSFALPGRATLVVIGVAAPSDAPAALFDGPIYEAEIATDDAPIDPEGRRRTLLYGAHNIRHAVDGGAEYAGKTDVDDPTEPFWCAGCDWPHRGREQHSTTYAGEPVCSYGCAREAQRRRARTLIERAD